MPVNCFAVCVLNSYFQDFIRAAMTCITYFYEKGAYSYPDLNSNIHHLYDAKKHMESYLDDSQWDNIVRPHASPLHQLPGWGSRPPGQESLVRKILSPNEVNRYVPMSDITLIV